jgi:DNA-binding GntR family transcriptional regulator
VRILAERRDVPPAAAKAVERFRGVVASGDALNELVESDVEFHRALVAASQTPSYGACTNR